MAASTQAAAQDHVNRAVYHSPGVYRRYLSLILQPSETACLLKYQPHFAARDVLDIGAGAGRTTRYLAPLARRYEAVDYSPVMVSYLKSAMPGVSVRQADFRDLSMFSPAAFDFILASDNVIDALSPEDRMVALSEASRVLRPGGLFVFSSHNLRYQFALSGPRFSFSSNPAHLAANSAKFLLSTWNHLRVGRLRKIAEDHALLNDPGHFYACLHYYAARPTVARQLEQCGMRLIEAFDRGAQSLADSDDDSHTPDLLYVAERL
jgi:SAM-dependent methyltransferase